MWIKCVANAEGGRKKGRGETSAWKKEGLESGEGVGVESMWSYGPTGVVGGMNVCVCVCVCVCSTKEI